MSVVYLPPPQVSECVDDIIDYLRPEIIFCDLMTDTLEAIIGRHFDPSGWAQFETMRDLEDEIREG